MENILLEECENRPKIIMDREKRLIEFEGMSYPENTFSFYRPITEWLKDYLKDYHTNNQALTINFKFFYFNSATTQIIFEILDVIQDAKFQNIEIYWFYDKENKNGYEDYEDYAEEFPKLNIQAVEYSL